MKASTPTLVVGLIIIFLILFLFIMILICDTNFTKDVFYCQPFIPLLEMLGSAFG